MERPGTAATVPSRVVIGEFSKLFHPLEIGTQKLFKKICNSCANLKTDLTVLIC
jgi:hypothetical protein